MRGASATAVLCAAAAGGWALPRAQAQTPPASAAYAVAVHGWPKADARRWQLRVQRAARAARVPGLAPAAIGDAAFAGRRMVDPAPAVDAATGRLDLAARALNRFELAGAKLNVQAAMARLQPHLGLTVARRQDLRRLRLAVALAHAERDAGALSALSRSFVQRFWSIKLDRMAWPPDVREQVERMRQRTPTGTLSLTSRVPAQASVDGVPLGPTPIEIRLPVGRHRVEVAALDLWPQAEWVDVSAGAVTRAELNPHSPIVETLLGAEALSADLEERILEVAHTYGLAAVITVGPATDGRVRLQRLGASAAGPVVVEGSPEGLRLGLVQLWSPEADDAGVSPWPYVVLASGAAILAGGIALESMAQSTQDDFRRRRASLTQSQAFALRDQAEAELTGGHVLIGLGTAAMVGGLTWLVLEWTEDDDP